MAKSLAEQLAELEDPTPKDFDPEDLDRGAPDSDDEGDNGVDENAGREHYQAVGKAKLRKQDPIELGKQYAGSRVSRDALEAESDDDPFKARSSDEEDDSEEEEDDDDEGGLELGSDEDISDESEEEEPQPKKSKDTKKGKKQQLADDMESEGSEEDSEDFSEGDFDDEEIPSDDEEEDESEEDDDDDDEDEDEDDEEEDTGRRVKFAKGSKSDKTPKSDDKEELRRLMASDQKSIAATISSAAKADAAKGKAVKQQRATFDALLNTRIKLQKGLTAINQLAVATNDAEDVDEEAIKSAESAALTLWSTLEDLRITLADAQSPDESKKRKRPDAATSATSSASLWKRMTDLEAEALAHRRSTLDKWSSKVRGSTATIPNARGKLLGSAAGGRQNITAVLDAQVASESGDRAVKRARKADGKSNGRDNEPIYDDTIFYQALLRELVEQRMSSSDAITNGIDTLHVQLPSRTSIHPVTGMRKDKVKREIDTRASKGRKMKFDVHEKLQNFMAPEDRGTWTNHSREEFFASLLGKTASGLLREGDDEDASAAEDSDEDMEEGGLKLFRS